MSREFKATVFVVNFFLSMSAVPSDLQGSVRSDVAASSPAAVPSGNDACNLGLSGIFHSITTGTADTACGISAMYYDTTGSKDTAYGEKALFNNTTGNDNMALGTYAMFNNTTGQNNSAIGYEALESNTVGINNVAIGSEALLDLTSGTFNIAIGNNSGQNLTTESNNVDIASKGVAGDAGTIRIGDASTQTAAFVAGIYNTSISGGSAVMVSPSGQLGVVVSSERFKTAIHPIGTQSDRLAQLRPVTFHLKSDPHGATQYGLIAEEVAKVYPDLVIRSASGRIDGVRYDELAPLLLNELQQERSKLAAQQRISDAQQRISERQSADIRALQRQLTDLRAMLEDRAPDRRVARR